MDLFPNSCSGQSARKNYQPSCGNSVLPKIKNLWNIFEDFNLYYSLDLAINNIDRSINQSFLKGFTSQYNASVSDCTVYLT